MPSTTLSMMTCSSCQASANITAPQPPNSTFLSALLRGCSNTGDSDGPMQFKRAPLAHTCENVRRVVWQVARSLRTWLAMSLPNRRSMSGSMPLHLVAMVRGGRLEAWEAMAGGKHVQPRHITRVTRKTRGTVPDDVA